MHPYLIVGLGISVVLLLILVLRLNAFVALISAALVVSFLAPGEAPRPDGKPGNNRVERVAVEFGAAAGKIGLVIGFAAVIGESMMRSGAADRIVHAFLRLMGAERASWALMSSSFVLSVPVFFDTVFYLLIPLARSMYQLTRRRYLFYVCAIAAGGAITHTLVPPTPGPYQVAVNLDLPIGTVILVGLIIAVPSALVALLVASWMDGRIQIATLPVLEENVSQEEIDQRLAAIMRIPLFEALLPVLLPVLLISGDTIVGTLMAGEEGGLLSDIKALTEVFGHPAMALLISMTLAIVTWIRFRRPVASEFSGALETALLSGGLVILITSAGGAFGGMLRITGLSDAIQGGFEEGSAAGTVAILAGFAFSSLMKVAQGSSTTAMITVSAMMGSMALTQERLGFSPVYLATAICGGSLVGSWMNDSGFWIFARMSGLTEAEALKTWTPLLVVLGFVSLVMTIGLSIVMPLNG